MFLSGLLTAVGFVAIAAKFSPTFLQKVLGYDWLADLVLTIGLFLLFGTTGTISGMMNAVITGLFISGILFVCKNFYKYQKYEVKDGKRQWVTYPGKWTPAYIAKSIKHMFDGWAGVAQDFQKGWNEKEKDVTPKAA